VITGARLSRKSWRGVHGEASFWLLKRKLVIDAIKNPVIIDGIFNVGKSYCWLG
jgi:hypothetical protein